MEGGVKKSMAAAVFVFVFVFLRGVGFSWSLGVNDFNHVFSKKGGSAI
jgi:hypothetical protein